MRSGSREVRGEGIHSMSLDFNRFHEIFQKMLLVSSWFQICAALMFNDDCLWRGWCLKTTQCGKPQTDEAAVLDVLNPSNFLPNVVWLNCFTTLLTGMHISKVRRCWISSSELVVVGSCIRFALSFIQTFHQLIHRCFSWLLVVDKLSKLLSFWGTTILGRGVVSNTKQDRTMIYHYFSRILLFY